MGNEDVAPPAWWRDAGNEDVAPPGIEGIDSAGMEIPEGCRLIFES